MKCTITIETSDFSELKALFGMMLPVSVTTQQPAMPATPSEPVLTQTVKVTLKDPDTGESHVITRRQKDSDSSVVKETPLPAFGTMLTPMGPMPVVQNTQPTVPSQKRGEERYCEGCSRIFTPKHKRSRYCSDKCSQKAYSETYLKKKNRNNQIMESKGIKTPVNQLPSNPRMSKEEQDLKLKELREKYPVNNTPPRLERDFTTA